MSSKTLTPAEYDAMPVVWTVDPAYGGLRIEEKRLVSRTEKTVTVAERFEKTRWCDEFIRVDRKLLSDSFQVFSTVREAFRAAAAVERMRAESCRKDADSCLKDAAEHDANADRLERGND